MKTPRLALALAVSAVLSACAYVPLNQAAARRVSPDYTASGSIEDARAYVYGDHTVIEFDRAEPAFLLVRDQTGESVKVEKVGRLYRLDRRLDSFTLWLNGSSATFTAAVVTRVFSAPVAAPVAAPVVAEPEPVKVAPESAKAAPEDVDVSALLKLSEKQLEEVRQVLAAANKNPKATGAELYAVNARLDEIEARLVTAAAAIVRVSFPTASTDFKPSPDVARVLIASAKDAQAINVRGHTDARIAGPADAKIALGRALAARKFLVDNGIDGKKISVFSTAAGDFTAPNLTNEGRAVNRRVEVEFVNSRIADLKGQAVKLAGK